MTSKIILGYRRKSAVRDQADLISPEQQQHACEQWIQLYLPGAVIEWYEDVEGHRSGRQEKGRPGWLKLLEQIDRPEVAGVIVWSLDRAYRNVQQFLNFLARLEGLDKRLVTVKENLDTRTAMGRTIVTILMAIAQLESDQTSERLRTGIKYRREVLGRYWGKLPFACQRDPGGQLVASAETYHLNLLTGEAATEPRAGWEERRYYDSLAELYRIYSQGHHSCNTVAGMLNEAGWRFQNNAGEPVPFSRADVLRQVASWRLFRGELPTGGRVEVASRNGSIFPGGHAPILPPDLCETVGRIWDHRGGTRPRRTYQNNSYILSPVLYCATCGGKLKGAWFKRPVGTRPAGRYYRHAEVKGNCPERWLWADDIEVQAIDVLLDLAQAGLIDDARAKVQRLAQELIDADGNGAALAEIERQRARLDRLEDLYLDEAIDRERYGQRRAEIVTAIAKLEGEMYSGNDTTGLLEELDRLAEEMGQIEGATPERLRGLVFALFDRVEVSGGEISRAVVKPWLAGVV